jgi:hypothetical protein
MFDTLVGEIEEESVRNVFRVEYAEEPQRPTRPAPARLTATKEAVTSAFSTATAKNVRRRPRRRRGRPCTRRRSTRDRWLAPTCRRRHGGD